MKLHFHDENLIVLILQILIAHIVRFTDIYKNISTIVSSRIDFNK